MFCYQSVIHSRFKGYSLIEFMIAIAISSIIMLAVAIAWQSGFRSQRSQSDFSRLNETIRFSMDLLSREIRLSGLINTTNTSITPAESNFCSEPLHIGSSILGANDPGSINPAGVAAGAPLQLPAGATAVLNSSDAIRVRYYGEDPTAGTGITATTEPSHDCLGNAVAPGLLVEDTLYVAAAPDGEPALWCRTSNPAAAANPALPMVSGVESLQLLYGEILDVDKGIVNQYVPWQLVSNTDNIRSIKVSIVARSARPDVSLDTGVKIFNHFGNGLNPYVDPTGGLTGTTFTAPEDGRLRLSPMSTEISIRNFGFCG